ncbi:bifunctional (p)ppGpp synthetase/guanosine-3',5'-bis(diphosphate) 3'-pyrophosphohydrolase [bacterium]|nr:bifunctional (p)ppGpp synthetase/guanosine-3',5'-bis(diphosphate) 3'-pyrophosphohydrolase [bacterium]
MDRLILPEPQGLPTVEDILGRMDPRPNDEAGALIRKAYERAREDHEKQLRKSGEPYFAHPARVAWLLAGLVNEPVTVAAGLLHDTIEDCGETYESLKAQFGEEVATLVDGVTKISTLTVQTDQEHQVVNLRKMILAMARDVRVVLIKLCDRLHNMQTLEHLPLARRRAIAQATMDIYAPLANRLGMIRMRTHLEDLAMRHLHPAAFANLKKKMEVRSKRDQEIVDTTRQMLSEELKARGIPAIIQGRRKNLYSLFRKMQRQGLSFDEVHDIIAIRVITDSITECYDILGIVHSLWKPISGRFKDYIATPKENGYQSIHTSIIGVQNEVVEIQIRTREMHHVAEEGIAAHWKYKEGGAAAPVKGWQNDEKRLQWLRQLVDWLQEVRDPSEFMTDLKTDVFETSVFVYTPKGDIIEVPRGATALDLAFRIHSQLGLQCAGVRINNRMMSIRTELKTGDIVEIITNKNAHPTPDWLQFAQTGRARNKIRHWLKESQHEEFLERGRHLLMEGVRARFGNNVGEDQVEEILKPTLRSFNVPTWEDLLVELGCGTLRGGSLLGRLGQVLHPPEQKRIPRAIRRGRAGAIVLVDGMDGAVTRMARCCSPLPGDDIIGFITQGRGISIHKADCVSLARIRERSTDFNNRVVPVEWGDASNLMQKVTLRIVCQDRKGLLSDVSAAITQLAVNIVGAHTSSNLREGRAILKFILLIKDTEELNTVLNRLATIPGVLSLSRTVHEKA